MNVLTTTSSRDIDESTWQVMKVKKRQVNHSSCMINDSEDMTSKQTQKCQIRKCKRFSTIKSIQKAVSAQSQQQLQINAEERIINSDSNLSDKLKSKLTWKESTNFIRMKALINFTDAKIEIEPLCAWRSRREQRCFREVERFLSNHYLFYLFLMRKTISRDQSLLFWAR